MPPSLGPMRLYRLLLTLAAPAVALFLALRLVRGRERPADLRARLGHPAPSGTGPVLWLHGASVGELTAARPLVEALLARRPDLAVRLTCNTVTGRDTARRWGLARVTADLAPLDYRPCLAAFLRRVHPDALAVVENELWPNRLAMAHARGLPVALVGARLSARSARRWARLAGLLSPLLARLALVAPQDAASADRLSILGVPGPALAAPVALKSAVALPPPAPDTLAALGYDRAATVLAASTHAGEEGPVLEAFAAARDRRPDLRLILALRHPDRAGEIAALIAARGLAHRRRTTDGAPGDAPVYLADTLGEMALWYAAAGTCFVGGSLVEKGGHTPWEPAQFGCALLTGPHVENAAEAYARLRAAGAVVEVADAGTLADALARLDAARQRDLGARAQAALTPEGLDTLAAELDRALLPPAGRP